MTNIWTTFWQKDSGGFTQMMRVTGNYFMKKLPQKVPFTPKDEVLDIGCGPGLIAEHFMTDIPIASYQGLDVSEHYLKICKEKFASKPNFQFQAIDPEHYLGFPTLQGRKFSKIIVMSVIQYYKNVQEVEMLISEMQKLAHKGCTLVIADIITDKGSLMDIIHLAWKSLQNGFFGVFVRFILYARFSNYYQNRQKLGLLTVSVNDLKNIIQKMNLNAQIVDNLTANAERKSLIIYF